MKKKDWMIGAGVLVLALILLVGVKVQQRAYAKETTDRQIVVTVDGSIYGTYSLLEDQVIEVKEGDWYNRIRIQDGQAFMEEANCPDGYCEKQGKISNQTQSIVCLPHKLVVEVKTEIQEDVPDSISK